MSIEFFKEAQGFFSEYALKDENKERVGEMLFVPKEFGKGRIDIKVLTQPERALLHFSVTGKIPQGFSEKQLQKALKELKGKSSIKEGNIEYEHSLSSSIAKKVHHVAKRAVKGNVIETDHIYDAIKDKERAITSLWVKIEWSNRGKDNLPAHDKIKQEFFRMVRAMPKENFEKFSALDPDEIYKRVAASLQHK